MKLVNKMEVLPKEENLYSIIEKIGTLQRYQKNEIIYLKDDEADTFYLLKSGGVRLFFTSINGNELTVKILGAEQVFGDASYFSKSPRATSASAITNVELLSVDLDSLLPYFAQEPRLVAELLNLVSQTIHLLSNQVYSMAFLSADKKVAHLLVQLSSYFKKSESDPCYTIDYTHQDLAELIGIARVTTTKELRKFEKRGWISLDYRNIKILDEAALKEYSIS